MVIRRNLLVWTMLYLFGTVTPLSEVLKKLNYQFGMAARYCHDKLQSNKELVDKFYHFWNSQYELTPDMGCVMECTLKRLELLDPEDRLVQVNAYGLTKANGLDETTSSWLVKSMAECNRKAMDAGAGCVMAAAMAQCVRADIQARGLIPMK